MISALDHTAAAIEKLVFDPFQRNAEMRAAVLIEVNLGALFDCKEFAPRQIETLAASLGDISKGAKAQLVR